MKIALAQVNQIVGQIKENTDKILKFAQEAKDQNADLIVFPEFSVVGGFCNDLFLCNDFIIENCKSMEFITSSTKINILAGVVTKDKFNQNYIDAVALFSDKDHMTVVSAKEFLNDAEFNDKKYFNSTGFSNVFKLNNKNIACIIADSQTSIEKNIEKASWLGIDLVILLNCSVYYKGKTEKIRNLLKFLAKENSLDIAYVNMVGAHDGYVFDGGSLYVDKNGEFKALAETFQEELIVFDIEGSSVAEKETNQIKELYDASVLGLRDYIEKNNFKKCAFGISGGIDSALTLAIAVDAIGSDNVLGVLMPSKYTSKESIDYSLELCKNLNVQTKTIPINDIYNVYINQLTPFFDGKSKDLTEENLQARIRSNILMSLSNKFGYFILCTCNKSEDAVGYSTLYGDATGGYSPISDLYKKEVYELSKYRNTISKAIPEFIITRPPTAELRENQKDSDSLPEYDILDDILVKILDKKMTYSQIIESGVKEEVLNKVWKLLSISEYKRRQSPIGTKISQSAFLRDINFPISNGYVWKPMREKDLCQKTTI